MRRSEAYFRALVENSLDAVAVVDADGTIRYESPSVERILGYRPEELIGRNALDFLHPEDVQRVAGNIVTAEEYPERAFSSEVRFLHKTLREPSRPRSGSCTRTARGVCSKVSAAISSTIPT